MSRRLQRALDGELSVHELNPEEAAQLRAIERTTARVLSQLPEPQINSWEEVRRRLARTLPGRRKEGWLAWLVEPRQLSVRWRPAYVLVAAVLLAVLAVLRISGGRNSALPTPRAQQVLVQFRLEAPGANQVALAGDFTGWKPAYTLRKSSSGVWTVVVPLDAGVHDYAFVVDGRRWIPDPVAPAVADGFGGMNSRLAVLTPDTR